MKIEGGKMVEKIVNHQFKIIGENKTFADIPDNGEIIVGKKKMMWYDHYKMTEEQEKEWREWYQGEIKDFPLPVNVYLIEMVYGFVRKYKKEGQLF